MLLKPYLTPKCFPSETEAFYSRMQPKYTQYRHKIPIAASQSRSTKIISSVHETKKQMGLRQIILFDREKISNASHFYRIPTETLLGDGGYNQFLESDRKFDKKN